MVRIATITYWKRQVLFETLEPDEHNLRVGIRMQAAPVAGSSGGRLLLEVQAQRSLVARMPGQAAGIEGAALRIRIEIRYFRGDHESDFRTSIRPVQNLAAAVVQNPAVVLLGALVSGRRGHFPAG